MLRLILMLPVLLVLVIFALSNTAPATFGFWPTDLALEAPLSVAVLVIAAVFFVFGALIAWTGTLAQVRRARRAEAEVRRLQDQVDLLRPLPVDMVVHTPAPRPATDALTLTHG
jgi:putative membrane protein